MKIALVIDTEETNPQQYSAILQMAVEEAVLKTAETRASGFTTRYNCPEGRVEAKISLNINTSKAPKYRVSGVRTTVAGIGPVLQITDTTEGKVWAFIPYSDRTPELHRDSYRDAIAACEGMNQKGSLV